MKRALILLNMGGPNNLNEVHTFLINMFKDPRILTIKSKFLRNILAHLITTMRHKSAKANYAALGGKSPIVSITKSLCERMMTLSEGEFSAIDFAMRYTPPFAKDVLAKYENFDEIVLLPLYPHHSSTTISSSLDDANSAIATLKLKANVRIIGEFYDNAHYNEIILNLIKKTVNDENTNDTTLVFSAHSLPQSIVDNGDLYQQHVVKHAEILKQLCEQNGLKFKDYKLAYQSKIGPVKWLEPAMADELKRINPLKAIIVPLSFCIDNSETVFELDVEYKNEAKKLGYELYKVVKCPNDSDDFARFLLEIGLKVE